MAERGVASIARDPLLREALPVLVLTGIGGLFTGFVLRHMEGVLTALPGLIMLVPGTIGLRGNISTTLGSRLGSAFHMGLIDTSRVFGPTLRANAGASLFLSALLPVVLGTLAWGVSRALGFPTASLWVLIAISLTAGVLSGLVLTAFTVGIVMAAFRYGLDPDNITGPGLATLGDVVTLLFLFGAAIVFGGFG